MISIFEPENDLTFLTFLHAKLSDSRCFCKDITSKKNGLNDKLCLTL